MKHNIIKTIFLMTFALAFSFNSNSQVVSDSINMTSGYSNQVFYNIATGTKTSSNSTEWDLQFFPSLYSASIRINSGFGVELYDPANSDTTNFTSTTIDTAGATRLRGTNISWEQDAFTASATGHPNYGWGKYGGSGNITGIKVFVIKLTSGVFKKIWIRSFKNTGEATFSIANLDGSSMVTKTINRSTYTTKRHFFYDVENDSIYNPEPAKADWDFVFKKYEENLGGGSYYSVAGALSNYNTGIAEVSNTLTTTAKSNWNTYALDSSINVFGHNWKAYDFSTGWGVTDSLSYIITAQSGDVYQIIFTGTGGSGNGKMYFTKEIIAFASIEENSPFKNIGVYPNPVQNILNINFELNNVQNNVSFTLIDVNGRIVSRASNNNASTGLNLGEMDMSNLEAGIYFLRINTDNYSETKRIIKQ